MRTFMKTRCLNLLLGILILAGCSNPALETESPASTAGTGTVSLSFGLAGTPDSAARTLFPATALPQEGQGSYIRTAGGYILHFEYITLGGNDDRSQGDVWFTADSNPLSTAIPDWPTDGKPENLPDAAGKTGVYKLAVGTWKITGTAYRDVYDSEGLEGNGNLGLREDNLIEVNGINNVIPAPLPWVDDTDDAHVDGRKRPPINPVAQGTILIEVTPNKVTPVDLTLAPLAAPVAPANTPANEIDNWLKGTLRYSIDVPDNNYQWTLALKTIDGKDVFIGKEGDKDVPYLKGNGDVSPSRSLSLPSGQYLGSITVTAPAAGRSAVKTEVIHIYPTAAFEWDEAMADEPDENIVNRATNWSPSFISSDFKTFLSSLTLGGVLKQVSKGEYYELKVPSSSPRDYQVDAGSTAKYELFTLAGVPIEVTPSLSFNTSGSVYLQIIENGYFRYYDATTAQPPSPVIKELDYRINSPTSSTITFNWKDSPKLGVLRYTLNRSATNDDTFEEKEFKLPFEEGAPLESILHYEDRDVKPGVNYTYTVTAHNDGEAISAASETIGIPAFIELTAAEWRSSAMDGSYPQISIDEPVWYKFFNGEGVNGDNVFAVQWKDSDGSDKPGDTDADITVSAYKADGNPIPSFFEVDEGWETLRTITAGAASDSVVGYNEYVYLQVTTTAGTSYDIRYYDYLALPPQTPISLSAVVVPSGVNYVSWTYVPNVSYELQRMIPSDNEGWVSISSSLTGTSYQDSGIKNDIEYRYRVQAISGTQRGPWSSAGIVKGSSTSTSLTYDTQASGSFTSAGDTDWYKFDSTGQSSYTATWTGNIKVSAFKADGTLIFPDYSSSGYELPGGTVGVPAVYLRVVGTGSAGLYTLTVK